MSIIHSEQNSLVKAAAVLQQKKYRDETGRILVEGIHPIEEAVRAGLTLQTLFLQEGTSPPPMLAHIHTPVMLGEKAMRKLATTQSPPPAAAVFDKPAQRPQRLREGLQSEKCPLLVILDGIQDPGNCGTLIRSALAFGAHGLILLSSSADPDSPKVIRASAGLVFALPVLEIREHEALSEILDGLMLYIATAQESGALAYRQADFTRGCALVLGNEGHGVSESLRTRFALQAQAITIAMSPRVESLNVAVSGAVLLAEAAAQRTSRQGGPKHG